MGGKVDNKTNAKDRYQEKMDALVKHIAKTVEEDLLLAYKTFGVKPRYAKSER